MSASDNLHPVQFPGKADMSDSDRDKAALYDTLGMDTDENYGYSEEDPGDYQYKRELTAKDVLDTKQKREVF